MLDLKEIPEMNVTGLNKLTLELVSAYCIKIIMNHTWFWNRIYYKQNINLFLRNNFNNTVKIALSPANELSDSVVRDNYFNFNPTLIFDDIPSQKRNSMIYPIGEAKNYTVDKILILSRIDAQVIYDKLISSGVSSTKIIDYSEMVALSFENQLIQYITKNFKIIYSQLKLIIDNSTKSTLQEDIYLFTYQFIKEVYLYHYESNPQPVDLKMKLAGIKSDQFDYIGASEITNEIIDSIENGVNTLRDVAFLLTWRCNLKCIHCSQLTFSPAYKQIHTHTKELSSEEIIAIFENSELLKDKNLNIYFSGGEIFVRDDLEDILEGVAQVGQKFLLLTNGCFPKKIQHLIENPIIRRAITQICFSMDGTPTIHDNIRGKGAFRKLKKSIDICLRENIPYKLTCTIQKTNFNYLEEIFNFGKNLGRMSFGLECHKGRYLRITDVSNLRKYISEDHYFSIHNEDKYRGSGCLAGIKLCHFSPDGTIEACGIPLNNDTPSYDFLFGNIRNYELNFDELWYSTHANRVRKKVTHCNGCAMLCGRSF